MDQFSPVCLLNSSNLSKSNLLKENGREINEFKAKKNADLEGTEVWSKGFNDSVHIAVERSTVQIQPEIDEDTDAMGSVSSTIKVRKRKRRSNRNIKDNETDITSVGEKLKHNGDVRITEEVVKADIQGSQVAGGNLETFVEKNVTNESDIKPYTHSGGEKDVVTADCGGTIKESETNQHIQSYVRENDHISVDSNKTGRKRIRKTSGQHITIVRSNGSQVTFKSLNGVSDSSLDKLLISKMENMYMMEEFSTYSIVREVHGFTIEFRLMYNNEIIYSAKHRKRLDMVQISRKAKCHLRDPDFDALIKIGALFNDFSLVNNCTLPEELMHIRFLSSKSGLGKQFRRRLLITVPCTTRSKPYVLLSRDPDANSRGVFAFSFDKFHIKDSIRNAQLVPQDDIDSVVMNIRKVSKDMIEVDTKLLVPPLSIFALGISSFLAH